MRYLARQPILNRARELFAYELLFRSSFQNSCDGLDLELASTSVLDTSFLIGLEKIAAGHLMFINCPRDFLLREGTDLKYGARHLKRAVERNLVHPMSNLIATGQVRGGDLLRIDLDGENKTLAFYKDAEDMPTHVMARMVDMSVAPIPETLSAGAVAELPKVVTAKTTKR